MNLRLRKWLTGIAVVVAGLVFVVVALEFSLRAVGPPRDRFYVWPPGMHVTFEPSPEYLPGVDGTAHVIINSDGVRGDEVESDVDYKILVIGGSSSECSYLDQSEAWPQQLQHQLQRKLSGRRVWVGNAGRSGITSHHHRTHLYFLLPQFEDIDVVVVLGGVNDLTYRLAMDDAYAPRVVEEPEVERALVRRSFSIRPDSYNRTLPPHKRMELWRRSTELMWVVARRTLLPDDRGLAYQKRRARRASATGFRDALPDLEGALDEYASNVRAMIELARQYGCRIVFLTHPSMWRGDMPPELSRLLWFGAVGDQRVREPGEYYSVTALQAGLDRFNLRLMEVCSAAGVDCLDLAPQVQADTTIFYDDVHLNEQGARRVAELTANFLTRTAGMGEY